jgi:nucleoside-diphosphate-sugar epimerase
MGRRLVVLGNGKAILPLVHVDDVVEAMILAPERNVFDGSIFHLVNSAEVTQADLVHNYLSTSSRALKPLFVPKILVLAASVAVQILSAAIRRPAPLSVYRVQSALATTTYDCSAATRELGWEPKHVQPMVISA